MAEISIERILQWAFNDELPKDETVNVRSIGAGSAWDAIGRYSELETLIDISPNRHGVVPDFAGGDVHPDAELIGEAVRSLDDWEIVMPENWKPFTDLDDELGLIAQELERYSDHIKQVEPRSVRNMVIRCAVLKNRPVWEIDPPETMIIKGGNGRPAWFIKETYINRDDGNQYIREVNGYNSRSKRPMPGAYNKFELSHSMIGDAQSRFDYQLWVAALHHLAEIINDDLQKFTLTDELPDELPWELVVSENIKSMETLAKIA